MISIELFNETVVALREPTGKVYESCRTYIEAALDTLRAYMAAPDDAPEELMLHAARAACCKGAYDCVPLLDLVATPNGFGIVSNQTIAPASPHRVQALRQELLLQYTLHRDRLLYFMAAQGVKFAPNHAPRTLCWAPFVLTQRGISVTTGRPLNVDEYRSLLPDIAEAEMHVRGVLGDELYKLLVQRITERHKDDVPLHSEALDAIHEAAMHHITAIIAHRRRGDAPQRKALAQAAQQLQDVLNRTAELVPEYKASSQYAAFHTTRYTNKKADPCFFS